ncbi:sialate O-acetylesterase [Acuticoccus sediminis]|uniref:sialate O-acetylesterase n=1 Tax=Acuticoccus sediminis TaxID=2184697 RepID=UPI001CFF0664|nr:sialate O-acetylesterase [Acuticoccus sediminis]
MTTSTRWLLLVLGAVALLGAFTAGGMTGRRDLPPWPQLSVLKGHLAGTPPPPESRYRFDANGRIVADETKTHVVCPAQSDRTAVLLVLGQSNAANHAGQRYRSAYGNHVVNFFEGQCFVAASPLLGATDTKGEYWTELGNLLVASGTFDTVVIAPLAFDGSEVARWVDGGDLNALLIDTMAHLGSAGYRVTEVLWHQGEMDYVLGTSAQDYSDRFLSMIGTLRTYGIAVPVYVSVASVCLEPSNGGFKAHAAHNPIVRAQAALPALDSTLRPGVNTDTLLDDLDRFDDCHIGGSGTDKVARAWADLLLNGRGKVGG